MSADLLTGGGAGDRDGRGHDTAAPARRTAIDPVCEMTVDPATALSAEVAGATYYFCTEYCRDVFVSNPAAFAGQPRADGS